MLVTCTFLLGRRQRRGGGRLCSPTAPGTTRLQLDAFALHLHAIQLLKSRIRASYVIKLHEFVVLLMGRFTNLLYLAVVAEESTELIICNCDVQIEYNQGALIHIFVRRVLFGNGIMNVQFAAAKHATLKCSHGRACSADVKIRHHDKATMFTRSIHVADFPTSPKRSHQLLIFHIAVDVANKEGARGVLSKRVLAARGSAWW
mmetsp:Transcript_10794/g.14698  ORF Transcript_10794/g.14698 Transcript_10794/m.14698 type:complete len:203 (-) Transcript_10794:115-723(-)